MEKDNDHLVNVFSEVGNRIQYVEFRWEDTLFSHTRSGFPLFLPMLDK